MKRGFDRDKRSSLPINWFFLAGSQSPRLMDRLSVDSDRFDSENVNVMTKLRSDLADAMMDTSQMMSNRIESSELTNIFF